VLAIPEVLAIYRVHGANSHYTSDREVPIETRKSKLRMWQTVIAAMRKWLAENGYTRKLAPVRAMQDHWTIIWSGKSLQVAAARAAAVFRYLLRLLPASVSPDDLATAIDQRFQCIGVASCGI